MLLFLLACARSPLPTADVSACEEEQAPGPDGRALFVHTWTVGDPLAAGGDGLGPVFNDRSCVACHALGGPGGAGGSDHDVRVGSLLLGLLGTRGAGFGRGGGETDMQLLAAEPVSLGRLEAALSGVDGTIAPPTPRRTRRTRTPPTPKAADLTPGRDGSAGHFRNTPALWGAGLLDAVPDEALVAAATTTDPDFPEVAGRVGRDDAGRVTRFGWKGHVATLADFVALACGNELGLDTPTVAQAGTVDPMGYDLDDAQVAALVAFVASLPAPERTDDEVATGEEVFGRIGCESCHRGEVGGVGGAYTDLLLHDMGTSLSDATFGYGGAPIATDGPAAPGEWRTPPLWGVRDSGPWMHDGRARTLEAAILLHGGEARLTQERYAALSAPEREALEAFLRSLAAPGAV